MACVGSLVGSVNNATVERGLLIWAVLLSRDPASFVEVPRAAGERCPSGVTPCGAGAQALRAYGGCAFASGYVPTSASAQSLVASFVCSLARHAGGCDVLRAPRVLETVIGLCRRCADEATGRDGGIHIPVGGGDASGAQAAIVTQLAIALWGYAAQGGCIGGACARLRL